MKHEILITGGRRGLGRHLALHLALRGHSVHLLGRATHESLDADLRRVVAGCLVADLADRAALDAVLAEAAERARPFDAVIANAAMRPAGRRLLDYEPDEIRQMIDVNLTAPAVIARALLPAMIARGRGRIVFIGSRAAFGRGPRESVYAATKAGLVALVESLAAEVDGRKVTVNAICPGRLRTESTHDKAGDGRLARRVVARTAWLLESHVNGRVVPVVSLRHRLKDARRSFARAARLLLPRG